MGGSIATSRAGDHTVYHLRDDRTGSSASILPSYGFNLFELNLPVADTVRSIVASEQGWAANPSRPARSGFPLLFPFAGRIRDARFEFQGQSYELVANKPPHAIHGFAYDVPWDVVEHVAGKEGATILGRFQISRNAPLARERWPADAILEVRYTLAGRALTMDVTVTNPSESTLPWTFGLHSYFRLPMDGRSDLSGARIVIPGDDYWELVDSLPTGKTLEVAETKFDFRHGRSMAGLSADLALTGLARDAQGSGAVHLVDERVNCTLQLRYDRAIRQIVVFTPPGSPGVVAIEPYTGMADPFTLRERGADPNLGELAPGASIRFALGFETLAEMTNLDRPSIA